METLKYYICLCLVIAPVIRVAQGNSKVTVSPPTVNITTGGNASIECIPEGSPLPKVTWLKANGDFRYGVRQSVNTLIISDARKEDYGDYVCQGLVDGTMMSSAHLRVDIKDAVPAAPGNPKVTVSQRTLSISKGGSGSIECIPEGNPLPTVQWIKSDGEFGDRVRQIANKLIISDAQDEDRGRYTCQGIVNGTFMVTDYSRVDMIEVGDDHDHDLSVKSETTEKNTVVPISSDKRTVFRPEAGLNPREPNDSKVEMSPKEIVFKAKTTETSNDRGPGPLIDDDRVDHHHDHDLSVKSETTEKNTVDEEPIISTTTYVCISSIIFLFIVAILVYFYCKNKCLLRDKYYSRFYGKTWGDDDSCIVMIGPEMGKIYSNTNNE